MPIDKDRRENRHGNRQKHGTLKLNCIRTKDEVSPDF